MDNQDNNSNQNSDDSMVELNVKVVLGQNSEVFTVSLPSQSAFKNLKEYLQNNHGFQAERLRLIFSGKELDNNESVAKIPAGSTVFVVQRAETVTLKIKFISGKESQITISKTSTIEQLKKKIEDKEQIPKGQQELVAQGKKLHDSTLLSDHNIQDGNTLFLVVRPQNNYQNDSSASQFNSKHSSSDLYQHSLASRPPGYCGLTNFGNTCYMNTALQCLSHTGLLRKYYLDNFAGSSHQTQARLSTAFAGLLRNMWSGNYGVVSPFEFRGILTTFAPQFAGWYQHDTQELISFLLDRLHEELNVGQRPTRIEDTSSSTAEEEDEVIEHVATKQWEQHLLSNRSPIVDMFHGQLHSEVRCSMCSKKSITVDPFMYLPLPLSDKIKFVEILLIRSSGSATRYAIRLSDGLTIEDIKNQIAGFANLHPSTVILCAMGYGITAKLLTQDYKLGENEELFAYECPLLRDTDPENRSNLALVCFRLRWKEAPMVTVIPRSTNNEGLYSLIPETLTTSSISTTSSSQTNVPINNNNDTNNIDVVQPITDNDSNGPLISNTTTTTINVSNTTFTTTTSTNINRDMTASVTSTSTSTITRSVDLKIGGIVINREGHALASIPVTTKESLIHVAIQWISGPPTLTITNHISADNYRAERRQDLHLDDCMRYFSSQEKLDGDNQWMCPRCKQKRPAFKEVKLWRAPQHLIVQLKRFHFNGSRSGKISVPVQCPTEGWDIGPWLSQNTTQSTLYDLYAVANHMGDVNGGHYTASCKVGSEWVTFNDKMVSPLGQAPSSSIASASAYVLFYKRRDATESAPSPPDTSDPKIQEITTTAAASI